MYLFLKILWTLLYKNVNIYSMSIQKRNKLNILLQSWPSDVVFVNAHLNDAGYSNQLLQKYKDNEWLASIGSGAWKRTGSNPSYEGGLYAIQTQMNSSIHPGGKTALSLLGKAHYLELDQAQATLFCATDDKPPTWFRNFAWGVHLDIRNSNFLPKELGLTKLERATFHIHISSAERAIMECLYLAPRHQDMDECYHLMEGLTTLRPALVQALLESCTSIKVKRLFLYLADKCQHAWFKHLTLEHIGLGSGTRSLVSDGVYVAKYKITVPKAWEDNEQSSL